MFSRRTSRQAKVVLFIAIAILTLYLMLPRDFRNTVINGQQLTDTIGYKTYQGTVDNFLGFEPEALEDFPTEEAVEPKIPHIIHFIFITGIKGIHGIPVIYKANINSFLRYNPNWKYYFWTDESARELIKSKHPTLLSTWDSYPRVINKADALRYVLLYEYGGVYSDLDAKCMRPLDRATKKFSCILSPEPFEHSAILYKMPFLLNNGFMMCRPKHPFMKHAVMSLSSSSTNPGLSAKAGPLYLTEKFKTYMKFQPVHSSRKETFNSPFFYKWFNRADSNNSVYITNTHYFMNSLDKRIKFQIKCSQAQIIIVKRGCSILKKRKRDKKQKSYAFIDHQWSHIYSIDHETRMLPIQRIIPSSRLILYNASN